MWDSFLSLSFVWQAAVLAALGICGSLIVAAVVIVPWLAEASAWLADGPDDHARRWRA